jgi:Glutamine amidotransferase class-I
VRQLGYFGRGQHMAQQLTLLRRLLCADGVHLYVIEARFSTGSCSALCALPTVFKATCRYEVNPELVAELEAAALRFVGKDETGQRMEVLELAKSDHPFFLGVQYHPEFKSRPLKPSPPFLGLVAASINNLDAAYRSHEDSGRLSRSLNGSGRLNGRLQDLRLSDPK